MHAPNADATAFPEEDLLRARFYGLLSHLLSRPPDAESLALLRGMSGDDSALGGALAALAEAARATPAEAEREYNALFIGVTGGETVPFASFYLTGFLFERPLAELRATFSELRLARAEGVAEPEDHIATLLEVMNGLILGRFGAPADLDEQRRFFDTHIAPWASRFFADLEAAESAALYRAVARAGGLFMAIEAEAFAMA